MGAEIHQMTCHALELESIGRVSLISHIEVGRVYY